jgi:cysteine-rich repeat protein
MRLPFVVAVLAALCLASVGPAAAQTCGDYILDAGEQCDDGNTRNLDGCDSTCHFEQTHRANLLKLQQAADPTVCPNNRLGFAFTNGTTYNAVQNVIDGTVTNGSTSILFHMLGLDDLSGTADPSLSVGVVTANPIVPGSVAYNGNNDLDWWYASNTGMTDAQHQPVSQLPASLTAGILTAGPGSAVLKFPLGGLPTSLGFSSLVVTLPVGASSTPSSSPAGLSPGHEANEHVDPTLQSFATTGAGTTATMCGNISAASLAVSPIPPSLTGASCAEGYTVANTALDLLVTGCHISIIQFVRAVQPDQQDPNAPPAGAGPPYTLTVDGSKHVTGCQDSGANPVSLNDCLADAAYSSFFKMTTDRVILGDDAVFANGFESGDLSAWSGTLTDGGDLSVSPTAALNGTTQGLQGVVNDTNTLLVEDGTPLDENHYRARFFFDPSAFDPGEASSSFRTRIFLGLEENPTRRVFAIVLKRQGGQYSVEGRARNDDGTQSDTGFFDVTAAPHRVDLEWIRSSGPDANDGRFRFALDGSVVANMSGIDNSISSIDFARLGALSLKTGANGTLIWDEFVSKRRAPIP